MSRLLPCAGAQPRAQPTASARPCPAAVQRAVHTCLALSSAGCLLSILAGVEGAARGRLVSDPLPGWACCPAGHAVRQHLADPRQQQHLVQPEQLRAALPGQAGGHPDRPAAGQVSCHAAAWQGRASWPAPQAAMHLGRCGAGSRVLPMLRCLSMRQCWAPPGTLNSCPGPRRRHLPDAMPLPCHALPALQRLVRPRVPRGGPGWRDSGGQGARCAAAALGTRATGLSGMLAIREASQGDRSAHACGGLGRQASGRPPSTTRLWLRVGGSFGLKWPR